MKKTLSPLGSLGKIGLTSAAALSAGLLPHMALAQSSVTLYGVVDVGINYFSNVQSGVVNGHPVGGKVWSESDGSARGAGGSRWGLKGSEDLGGGMAAIFQLESGFQMNTGMFNQGGAEFGQFAFVGLASQYGSLTLGRQYSPQGDFIANLSPFSIIGSFADTPGDLDGSGRTRRVNNAIKFTSNAYSGFSFSAMYALGGVPGSFAQGQTVSAAAGYKQGPLAIAVGYFGAHDPNLSAFGNNPNSGPATTDNTGTSGSATAAQASPIYAGFGSAHTFNSYDAGIGYTFGAATLSATVYHVGFNGLGDLAAGPNPLGLHGNAVFNSATATAAYRINPELRVGAAYMYTRGAGVGGHEGATYQQVTLTAGYSLSKRTLLYFAAADQFASGINSLGQPAVAAGQQVAASANNRQLQVRVGINHSF